MLRRENFQVLLRVQIGVIVSFLLVKFLLRPYILTNGHEGVIKIFVLSYPNFCEAFVGSFLLVFIGLSLKAFTVKGMKLKISDRFVYLLAVIIAGLYVILQEFKFHNIGGENVYDPYDVLFSVIGLVVVFILLLRTKPSAKMTIENSRS